MAPNSPVSTRVPLPAPRSLSSATNRSYKGIATSGGAASMKLGRRPLLASPYSVNCDTTSTAPPTSASARFIFPSASPNSRSPRILSAVQARRSSVSVGAKPARTKNPTPIDPVTRPSTRTAARDTRCNTTRTLPRTARLRIASFHGDRLRQVPRLVHVAPPTHRDVVRQELQRQHGEHRRQEIERLRHFDLVVAEFRDAGIPLGHDRHDPPAARLHFLHVGHDLLVDGVFGSDEHHGHEVVDQRDRPMLHFGRGVALGRNEAWAD